MCAIHHEIYGNHKFFLLLCSQRGLMFAVGRRLGKNFFFSEAETKVVNYSPKLDTLMENLRDRALLRIQSNMQDVQHGMR